MLRAAKVGLLCVLEGVSEYTAGESSSNANTGMDVFGQTITTSVGVPTLKKQPECVCPKCQRNLAASRFAPHLEKCMGMGRNSSRLASRRLATNSKETYRDHHEDEDDAEDEDWLEPDKVKQPRRKRDRNSPRRNKAGGRGPTTLQDGSVTPPANYDVLSIEERSCWLSSNCGVISSTSRKICSRSTRCPVHTDTQRREIRIRWLSQHPDEETHVDIDSFTEGDTAALRESLAQLSGASSPAESTISTSSNPSSINTSTRSRREKGRNRGGSSRRASKPGSKNGSRGSTPPLMLD
eukprot:TCALIF_06814-PA protein Name:"Similar to ATXN7L3 Ataxin-7-like protein 3 (Homo sapiens)" AED:0.12 eAED:0.12 QI:0/0.66/0.75/0.75/1/1/4/965/294